MACFEPIVAEYRSHFVLVLGDVNSTAAAALVCAKLSVPVGHVEAGLRSFDRSMPEEINRVVTDQLSELLFTPSADANANLLREGIAERRIHFVGNVMIDTLVRFLPRALEIKNHGVPPKYGLMVYSAALLVRGRLGRPICWPLFSTAHLYSQKIGVASRSASKAIDSASP
jgi:UDP-N-acetylglucosamine 2-epimerase